MSQHTNEKLSALMDGEDLSHDLIDEIGKDAQLQGHWQRYHLVRATLRKEIPAQIHLDISAAVAAALETEATVLAPKTSRWERLPVVGNVIPLLRSGGQLAIAASVALAVIVGVQQLNQPAEIQPGGDAIPFGIGVQGGLSPVSFTPVDEQQPDRNAMMEQRRRISALLNDHHQQMRLKQLQEQVELNQTQIEPAAEEPNSQ